MSWRGKSDNPGASPPDQNEAQWYDNSYDASKKMEKVKKDYDGENWYVHGTFPEQLSLSSESIWPKEGKQWAWFSMKPYRASIEDTGGRRQLITDSTIDKRRFLKNTIQNETYPEQNDNSITNATIPHAIEPGTLLYKVRTLWSMYNQDTKLYDYDNTVPNVVYEHYKGCQTMEEFLKKYNQFCFTDVCAHNAAEIEAGLIKKMVETICVEISDYEGQDIILHENIENLAQNGSDNDKVSAAKYNTAIAFVIILTTILGISCCYFGIKSSGGEEKENHWTKL